MSHAHAGSSAAALLLLVGCGGSGPEGFDAAAVARELPLLARSRA